MNNFFKHLNVVLRHKFWVMYYCFKCGLYWQGLTHDLSKFSREEFSESIKYFQGNDSPINAAKKEQGYSLAWLHHRGRNKHHYLYWVDELDADKPVLIKMPYKYVMEMICDFLAAGKTYMGKDFSYEAECSWWFKYMNDLPNMKMHPATKKFVTQVFNLIASEGIDILEERDYLIYSYKIMDK